MTDESQQSPGLWPLADLTVPMAIRVAATLRLADHIALGTRTATELAAAVDADADALTRMMRHLVAAGVLARDAAGRYALTPLGETLRADHPHHMRAILDIEGAIGRAEVSFAALLHSVRTGQAAYPQHYGRSIWDDLSADPALSASFDAFMAVKTAFTLPAVVSGYDWGTLGHVIDVGGGDGALLIALLTRYPTLRGTVLEQSGPAEAARKNLARAGLADRADATVGSFFDPLPGGAGGYLLCDVLHDWNDQAAGAILRRCAEAAGDTGSVYVIERSDPDDTRPSTEMNLRMLAWFGGRERDPEAIAALATPAGLTLAAVHDADGLSIIELTQPREVG